MDTGKNKFSGQLKPRYIIIYVAIVLLVVLTFAVNLFLTPQTNIMAQILWLLGGLAFFILLVSILSIISQISHNLTENMSFFEKVADSLDKNREVIKQINQNSRLSETAKSIAFRNADRQSLREAVFDKLQSQDFDTAYEIIDEIAHTTIYRELAKKLRTEADRYKNATDQERINQVIVNIEKLLDNYQWARASSQIERLISARPESQKARAMRQRLMDNKQDRKKELLRAWDEAVKRQDTDRGLEVLRELDLYLTPNEGLALQEAARDVFRTKLHNLGVQFSLAVSTKQWRQAFETGRQIMRDFPNSRMAGEIRERMEVLKQRNEESRK